MDIGLWVLYAAPPKGLCPRKLTTYATYTKIPSVHSHAVGPIHTHIVMCCEGFCSKYTICNTLLKICLWRFTWDTSPHRNSTSLILVCSSCKMVNLEGHKVYVMILTSLSFQVGTKPSHHNHNWTTWANNYHYQGNWTQYKKSAKLWW